MCAHKDYIELMGMPTEKALSQHRFIAMKERPPHLLWNEWIHNNIPEKNIVFQCSSLQIAVRALEVGCGICVLPKES
ncbi:hypothetical protein [Photobacterium minamisatsumaniensis]|uniref:hypothetical protein n=1 Tax=Photobacterium minamisatsumaniensis TaxID=2910233 RepID=UPI003D112292